MQDIIINNLKFHVMPVISHPEGKFVLEKIDGKEPPINSKEIRAFLNIRNEISRLPYLFEYYENLGVDRFFVVDDKSQDGTKEWLLSKKNCHVFVPSNSFKEANAGVDWQNLMLNTYSLDSWALIIDADELLVYPSSEQVKISDLCEYLDHENENIMPAYMLDLYPADLSNGHCESGKPFYEICPYYDTNYIFEKSLNRNERTAFYPEFCVRGGPRLRKFYRFQENRSFYARLLFKLWVKLHYFYNFGKTDLPHYAPALIKAPLVKWRKNFKRISNHLIEAPIVEARPTELVGALLHFKFFSDFHNKAVSEVNRNEHFGGSQEYRRYLKHLKTDPNLTFLYKDSEIYKGTNELLDQGLIKTTGHFEDYKKTIL